MRSIRAIRRKTEKTYKSKVIILEKYKNKILVLGVKGQITTIAEII